MQAWYHCENTYPFVPQEVLDRADSVRGSLPNRYCDPKIAADLFHECLDEHLLCDDLGVNIVSIEHHAGHQQSVRCKPADPRHHRPADAARCGSSVRARSSPCGAIRCAWPRSMRWPT